MDYIKLAQRTISMLSSMVESGECHTTRSREMVDNAQHGLEKIRNATDIKTQIEECFNLSEFTETQIKYICTIASFAQKRGEEITKEEIRQWLTEEGFEGLAERI